jgi:glutamine synthetase
MGIPLFAQGAKKAGDGNLGSALFIRSINQYGYYIEYHPKPLDTD